MASLSTALLALSLSASSPRARAAVAAAAAREAAAVVMPSGLVYCALKDGTGASPTASDKVKVRYRGSFPDGILRPLPVARAVLAV